jgi:hypothetical protein
MVPTSTVKVGGSADTDCHTVYRGVKAVVHRHGTLNYRVHRHGTLNHRNFMNGEATPEQLFPWWWQHLSKNSVDFQAESLTNTSERLRNLNPEKIPRNTLLFCFPVSSNEIGEIASNLL